MAASTFTAQASITLPGNNTLSISLGSSLATAGFQMSDNAITEFDATINSNISVAGITVDVTNLNVDYSSSNDDLEISGAASITVPGQSPMDVMLGNTTTPGIQLTGGQVTSLDASFTGDITIGGMSVTATGLTVDYSSTGNASIDVYGSASITLPGNNTLSINLGSSLATAGFQMSDNAITEFDATINSNISVAGITVDVTNLNVDYSSSNDDLEISGAASITVAGQSPMDVMLGNMTTPGIQLTGGQVTSLDASFTGDITIGGMSVTATGLTVDYSSTGNGSIDVYGSASITLPGNNTLSISLGSSSSDAGFQMSDNQITEFDATINSNISVAGITVDVMNLNVDYNATNDDLEISGAASISFDGATQSVSIQLGTGTPGASGYQPGLVMEGGQVTQLDASINGDIDIAGLSIQATSLGIQYVAASDGNSVTISGTASFTFDHSTVRITLGNGSDSDPGGLVISNGQLESLQASVTGGFDLLGIDLQANGLGVDYMAANTDGNSQAEFAMYGGVSITSSFLNFSTTLGTAAAPGLVLEGSTLESLDITVNGGFSLFGFQVQANGLSVQYANSELELSGGIMLDFTSAFEVGAAISQGGLFINTSTGALSIPSTGLQISASATLGPFSIQDLMISFSQGSGGINFSASGDVDLPGGIDVDLTQLVIQNGQLVDIGVAESVPVPIGDTGFFLDSLSGSLDNLNNISQLEVSASTRFPSVRP